MDYFVEALHKIDIEFFRFSPLFVVGLCLLLLIIRNERTGYSVWIALCIFLLVLTVGIIRKSYYETGWDFNVYIAAVSAFENGSDPYSVGNLQKYQMQASNLPFVYPPISILFFKALIVCFKKLHLSNFRINYYILWCLFLTGTFFVIRRGDKDFQPLLLTTLLTTGFIASFWNFLTGNIGLIELFLFSLTFYFILKERYYLSAAFITVTAAMKIIPLVFLIFFIFLKTSKQGKWRIILFSVMLFVLISVASYFLFPDITYSYYQSVLGKLGGEGSPIHESGGIVNPSLFFLIRNVSRRLFCESYVVSFSIYTLFVGCVIAFFNRYVLKKDRDFVKIFSLGVISFFLVFPRTSPYSFAFVLLPVYFLIKEFDLRNKFLTVLVVSAVPLITLLKLVTNVFVYGRRDDSYFTKVLSYSQSICLLVFFVFFLVRDYFDSKRICEGTLLNDLKKDVQ